MKKLGILIAVLVVLFGGMFWALTSGEKPVEIYNIINVDDFKQKVENKESFTVYFYGENCNHCIAYAPVLHKVLGEQGLIINRVAAEGTPYNQVKEFIESMDETFQGTPSIFTFENGIIVDYLAGYNQDKEEGAEITNGEKTLVNFIEKNRANFKV